MAGGRQKQLQVGVMGGMVRLKAPRLEGLGLPVALRLGVATRPHSSLPPLRQQQGAVVVVGLGVVVIMVVAAALRLCPWALWLRWRWAAVRWCLGWQRGWRYCRYAGGGIGLGRKRRAASWMQAGKRPLVSRGRKQRSAVEGRE